MGKVIMDEERNKWIDVIAKLVRLTQEGKIRWSSESPSKPLFTKPDDKITVVYTTYYKGKSLRLYEKTSKARRLSLRDIGTSKKLAPNEIRTVTRVYLEFYDRTFDQSLWTFPHVAPLRDLVTAVQFQVAGVKDFIDELLEED